MSGSRRRKSHERRTQRSTAALAAAFALAAVLSMRTSAAAQDIDLGIPTSAPWMDPEAAARPEYGGPAVHEREKHPLEIRFWERVRADLKNIDRWRAGLLGVLRLASSRKAAPVFPPEPIERPELIEEYREAARETWARAMDCWLALDSMLVRYGEFPALEDPKIRSAAFLTARTAFWAQARFVRQWTALVDRDPALIRLFDEPILSLGLPAGAYTRISERFSGRAPARFSNALRSYRSAVDTWALDGVLGDEGPGWRRERRRDASFLPKASRRRMRRAEALRVLREEVLISTFGVVSVGGDPGDDIELQGVRRLPLFPPGGEDASVSVSSQIVYAIDTVRHWFQLDLPEGRRPDVLLSTGQVRGLAEALRPGDVLLLRRESFIGSIGQPGYWHGAGLFVGGERERKRFFGRKGVSEELRSRHPEAYKRQLGDGKDAVPRAVASADWSGVDFFELERFARADSLAVLRPRLEPEEIAAVLDSVFGAYGRPFDPADDMASRGTFGDAELVAGALMPRGVRPGVSPPPRDFFGRRLMRANLLVRRFDRRFGTDDQFFDLVRFFDADEARQTARSAPLEEFRRTWRRAKWVMKAEKEKSDEE